MAHDSFDSHSPADSESLAAGHEPNVLRFSGVVIFAVSLVAVGLIVLGTLSLVMYGFSREESDLRAQTPPQFKDTTGLFPSPRLQPDPNDELISMRRDQMAQLNNYGWVDHKAGVAHIPIDRAIDMLAKRGLPATKGATVEINLVPTATIPSTKEKSSIESKSAPESQKKEDGQPR